MQHVHEDYERGNDDHVEVDQVLAESFSCQLLINKRYLNSIRFTGRCKQYLELVGVRRHGAPVVLVATRLRQIVPSEMVAVAEHARRLAFAVVLKVLLDCVFGFSCDKVVPALTIFMQLQLLWLVAALRVGIFNEAYPLNGL